MCACGQQLLRKEEPKHLKAHYNHVNMSWPLEVLEGLSEEHIENFFHLKPFCPFRTTGGDHVRINFFLKIVVLGVN